MSPVGASAVHRRAPRGGLTNACRCEVARGARCAYARYRAVRVADCDLRARAFSARSAPSRLKPIAEVYRRQKCDALPIRTFGSVDRSSACSMSAIRSPTSSRSTEKRSRSAGGYGGCRRPRCWSGARPGFRRHPATLPASKTWHGGSAGDGRRLAALEHASIACRRTRRASAAPRGRVPWVRGEPRKSTPA